MSKPHQNVHLETIDRLYSYLGDERNKPEVDREWIRKEQQDERQAALFEMNDRGSGR